MTRSTKELTANKVPDEVIAVRKWRREHGVNLLEFAAMAGLNKDHLCAVETGKRRLAKRTRAKLDAFFRKWDVNGEGAR